jgi:hypothetical protein
MDAKGEDGNIKRLYLKLFKKLAKSNHSEEIK